VSRGAQGTSPLGAASSYSSSSPFPQSSVNPSGLPVQMDDGDGSFQGTADEDTLIVSKARTIL